MTESLVDGSPKQAARDLFRKDKKQTREKRREDAGASKPEQCDNTIEVEYINGRKGKILCAVCDGAVTQSGTIKGGYLPYHYCTHDGQVLSAVAFCDCKIGRYLKHLCDERRHPSIFYRQLPSSLILKYVETMEQLRDFNRRLYKALCQNVNHGYHDPDSHEWIEAEKTEKEERSDVNEQLELEGKQGAGTSESMKKDAREILADHVPAPPSTTTERRESNEQEEDDDLPF